MNTHVETFLDSWMANIDFQVVVDLGKVIAYLTKYLTKPDSDTSKGMFYVIKGILTRTLHRGKTVGNTSQKIMSKLLGLRLMSKQEVCHQINNYRFVHCTCNFIIFGLAPKADKVILKL